jgi:ankyrin repeat protein
MLSAKELEKIRNSTKDKEAAVEARHKQDEEDRLAKEAFKESQRWWPCKICMQQRNRSQTNGEGTDKVCKTCNRPPKSEFTVKWDWTQGRYVNNQSKGFKYKPKTVEGASYAEDLGTQGRRMIKAVLRGNVNGVRESLQDKYLATVVLRAPSVDLPDPDTQLTALVIATTRGHTACVKELLESGADPQLRGKKNSTPLAIAAAKGYHRIVNLILHFADAMKGVSYKQTLLSDKDDDGKTPLILAAESGHLTTAAALLVHAGANGSNGGIVHTQFELDRVAGDRATAIEARNLRGDSRSGRKVQLRPATSSTSGRTLSVVLEARDTAGRTALMHSSRNGHADLTRLFTSAGADYTATDSSGLTSEQQALEKGYGDAAAAVGGKEFIDHQRSLRNCLGDGGEELQLTLRSRKGEAREKAIARNKASVWQSRFRHQMEESLTGKGGFGHSDRMRPPDYPYKSRLDEDARIPRDPSLAVGFVRRQKKKKKVVRILGVTPLSNSLPSIPSRRRV